MTGESQKSAKVKSAEQAANALGAVSARIPDLAVVLGSGVNVLADIVEPIVVPYAEIFGIAPTVFGHAGILTIGKLAPEPNAPTIALFKGRYHIYEGHDWSVVTMMAKAIALWAVPKLYLTNAAGGINNNFNVGDLMVITGYRDLLNQHYKETGLLPALKGANANCRSPLTDKLLAAGSELSKIDDRFRLRPLQQGVYAGLTGPSYETFAEIDMLRHLGCDAVGMSTVPELQTIAPTATQVAAISVITNVWSPGKPIAGHLEVLAESQAASSRLDRLLRYVCQTSET